MKLLECLERIPSDRLRKLAARYGDGQLVDSGELGKRLLDEQVLSHALSGLTGEEMTALKIIALACGGKGVIVEQCHQKLNRMTRKWRRNGALVIDSLMQLGLVFTDRANYRQMYFIPQDLRDIILRIIARPMVEAVTSERVDTVESGEDPNLTLRTMHFLLSYVTKSGVRMTQNGEIFRRSQKGLAETLGISEEDIEFQGQRPGYLRFMLEYLRSRGLTRLREGEIEIVTDKVTAWIGLSTWKKRLDMYDYWQSSLPESDSDFDTILGFLVLVPDGQWVVLDRLLVELEPVGMSHSWQALPSRMEKFFFPHLTSMGLVNTGHSGQELACRLTALGKHVLSASEPALQSWEEWFFVQPNFEVLVPRDVSPTVLWQVEQLADLTKHDQMMVFLLSRASVYRALKSGMSAADIITFLGKYSKNPVPQNVTFSITNWCSRFGRAQFVSALLLHCDSPELAAEIQSVGALREFIIGQYTPTDLIIERSRYEEFASQLQENGFMPLPGISELKAARRVEH